jgi:hypothetical protein
VASTQVKAALGMSSSAIWRMPLDIVVRIPSMSWRAARRLRAGNSTVASATENTPWGSM